MGGILDNIISGFSSLWELIGSYTNTESSGGSVCMKSVPLRSLNSCRVSLRKGQPFSEVTNSTLCPCVFRGTLRRLLNLGAVAFGRVSSDPTPLRSSPRLGFFSQSLFSVCCCQLFPLCIPLHSEQIKRITPEMEVTM